MGHENLVDPRTEKWRIVPVSDVFVSPGLSRLLSQHEGGDLPGLFLRCLVGEEQQPPGILPLECYPVLIYLTDLFGGERWVSRAKRGMGFERVDNTVESGTDVVQKFEMDISYTGDAFYLVLTGTGSENGERRKRESRVFTGRD